MGLTVEVGMLKDLSENDPEGAEWLRGEIEVINEHLRAAGLPPHDEPVDGVQVASYDLLGYSGLHCLRRFAAHLARGAPPQEPGDDDADRDPLLEDYTDEIIDALERGKVAPFTHLVAHSDAEGYYAPIEFEEPIFAVEDEAFAGEILGSAPVLIRDLERIEAALGIPTSLDPDSEALWDAARADGEAEAAWQRYGIESFTCRRLLAAARSSVQQRALLVFA